MIKTRQGTSSVGLKEVISLLWDRLGGGRLTFVVALVLCLGQPITMMLLPYVLEVYFNHLEIGAFHDIQILMGISTAAFLLLIAMNLLGEYLTQRSMTRLNLHVSLELADEAQRLPLELAQSAHSSDLVQRITRDAKRTTDLMIILVSQMGNQLFILTLAVCYMLWLNWKVALGVLLISPLMLLSSHLMRKQLWRVGRDVAEQEAIVRQCQQDALQGIETVRAFGISDWMQQRFVEQREQLNRLYMRKMWWEQAISMSSSALANLVVIATVVLVGWMAIQESMLLGSLMAFFVLGWRVFGPLQEIGRLWGSVQDHLGGSERTYALWRAEKEPRSEMGLAGQINDNAGLCFDKVSFNYSEWENLRKLAQEKEKFLSELSLHVPSQSFTAIVGPSGSGKSTVAKLGAGLLFPTEGSVLIGGRSLLEDAEEARRSVAYVPQSSYLFSGTIRDNLLMVQPDAGEESVIEAAILAGAHDFIESLPKGYDTELGELGDTLSGGQKQRLAIARAVLSDRPIWIFDEATSALDLETEREVMGALKRAARAQGCTLLVVAHRLMAVQDADWIIVMEKGTIVQQGRHEDLRHDESGLYQQLWGTAS